MTLLGYQQARLARLEVAVGLLSLSVLLLVSVGAWAVWHGLPIHYIPPGGPGVSQPGVIPDVVATEYAYDVPSQIEGGLVTLNLQNEGGALHEYGIGQITGGHTPEETDAYIDEHGKPPSWVHDAGTFGIQSPGVSITATRQVDPGAYELLCFLPGP